MKIMSYINEGCEWGIVIYDAVSRKEFVIDPRKTQEFLTSFCSDRTIGYFLNRPDFFKGNIPEKMVEFLELEDAGMAAAERMKIFVERFIEQSDRTLLAKAATPVEEAEFLPPIPEPRLLWGLVGNVSSFSRSKWEMKQLQLVPQAHQRPIGSVVGHNQNVELYEGTGGNAEFAFVIGKKGRNIQMYDAMQYVAGYTVVNDMCHSLYGELISEIKAKQSSGSVDREEMYRIARETGSFFADADIFATLSSSWAGKYSDRMCGIGPWIVTPDEIGDPYDLLVTTKRCGERLGRGHTCGLLVGIERAIAYYSSFATLYPGDIIHLGSVAKDGFGFKPNESGKVFSMQSEIEKVGSLNINASMIERKQEEDKPGRQRNVSELKDITSLKFLNDIKLRQFYNVYGNTVNVDKENNLSPTPFPRFLCTPGTSVGTESSETKLMTSKIKASAEFCAIISKTARRLKPEETASHVLGYSPMICIENYALLDQFEKADIAFEREKALPEIYGRWGDNYNIISDNFISHEQLSRNNRLELMIGESKKIYNTSDYHLWFNEVISFISSYITLYPGDIISLGNLGRCVDLANKQDNTIHVTLRTDQLTINKSLSLVLYKNSKKAPVKAGSRPEKKVLYPVRTSHPPEPRVMP